MLDVSDLIKKGDIASKLGLRRSEYTKQHRLGLRSLGHQFYRSAGSVTSLGVFVFLQFTTVHPRSNFSGIHFAPSRWNKLASTLSKASFNGYYCLHAGTVTSDPGNSFLTSDGLARITQVTFGT